MFETRDSARGWVRGQIGPYRYEAQVFPEPSPYGINGGRTSRLLIRSDSGNWLVMVPTDDELVDLVSQVLCEVEEGPEDG